MLSPKKVAQPNPSNPALCRQDTTSPWSTPHNTTHNITRRQRDRERQRETEKERQEKKVQDKKTREDEGGETRQEDKRR